VFDKETIGSQEFHHIEFYCGDAKSTAFRFSLALGMPITCVSGQATGNDQCVTYGLQSGNVRFLFTAPYSQAVTALSSSSSLSQATVSNEAPSDAPNPLPSFTVKGAHTFFQTHGLAAKAIGLQVKDAQAAFDAAVSRGAKPILEPTWIPACKGYIKKALSGDEKDSATNESAEKLGCFVSEVELYGDVVLRFVDGVAASMDDALPILPNLAPHTGGRKFTYGIRKIDHAVGNVPDLLEALTRIAGFTGFHEFAEFTSDDVGTANSGLNSVVLASDSESVLLPLNEPTEGRRKSQIQTYLEQNEGPGLQHLALKTDDIFTTIEHMRRAEEELGGFELMKSPSDEYYRELPERLGDQLTSQQYTRLEELGILADADEEGVLLQIFTKPIGDRPTLFIEIIQRIGCLYKPDEDSDITTERPGCGGFGRGNFKELFKSIEDLEKTLKV